MQKEGYTGLGWTGLEIITARFSLARLQGKESVGWNQAGSMRGYDNNRFEDSLKDGMKPWARRETDKD